ncbi:MULTISPECIES: GntR family transcriptional regulator [Rhizobium/Agrobacterium group]|uniref:GntR family transcriptional regulator n=1 Tax=Rhizobium/Agrobacterium group TaxID=227290 RepID=UPI0010CC8377|nr:MULTISPECIES: GntR family transcriptional regulator [Rhizobium/Agrobacterium group]MCZ4071971.1 GntR family transcriptional regulator [Agrobacterium sp. LMR679]TKV71356.1 GntR family transcriptional regulator [Rhizobium sp. AU243]
MVEKKKKDGRSLRNAEGHVNQRDRAYSSFTEHLLSRQLRPGQFVSQRQLVELTQLPLAAIRELIPRLEAEGLLVTVPQRGMQIAQVDLNLVQDAFQVRLFLEKEAVQIFARLVSDETLEAIRREHLDIIDACNAEPDANHVSRALVDRAQELDSRFHHGMIDSLQNSILTNIYRVNAIKIRLIRQAHTQLNPPLVLPTMYDHLNLLDAIASRDPAAAAAAMEQHIHNAKNRAIAR